ncbi:MAG: DUF2089 domain-containing protein [Peptococcaceae bacterium]|jgi:hypothetical protein|nr:DUF2089 domain-containing protein [Peptococcaceae bacterium]
MVSRRMAACPSCGGKLNITVLSCPDCGMELRGQFENKADLFSDLSLAQRKFLLTFLRCRGNMSRLQEELNISYLAAKKSLEELLIVLGLYTLEENNDKTKGMIDVSNWNVDESSKKPSDIVKRKLKQCGGRTYITSYAGNQYMLWAEPDGISFGCDALHGHIYMFGIFDIVMDFLKSNGGKAKKGMGRAPLGSEKCRLETVAGVILQEYLGVAVGGSGVDPSFVIVAILDWAGLIHNKRGYVELIDFEESK